MKSILLVLRDAAKDCPQHRDTLRNLADETDLALRAVTSCPTFETMQTANGCFVRIDKALGRLTNPTSPQGGSMPLTQEQKAA